MYLNFCHVLRILSYNITTCFIFYGFDVVKKSYLDLVKIANTNRFDTVDISPLTELVGIKKFAKDYLKIFLCKMSPIHTYNKNLWLYN